MDYWIEGLRPTRLLAAFRENLVRFQKGADSNEIRKILSDADAILEAAASVPPEAILSLDVCEAHSAFDHSRETMEVWTSTVAFSLGG